MTRPLLLGHRGSRGTSSVPENTLASFDLSLEHGCDGFEFDVRRTCDGTPVVCHDECFRGLRLAHAGPDDLALWQGQGFLPTLEQVLERYSTQCFLDIEIKDTGCEARALELLCRHPPRCGSVLTSFLPEVLSCLRELDSEIELGLLWDRPSSLWRTVPAQWALPECGLVDADLAADLKGAHKRLGTWTINHPSKMLRFAALGAEILISDDTERLVNTFPVG